MLLLFSICSVAVARMYVQIEASDSLIGTRSDRNDLCMLERLHAWLRAEATAAANLSSGRVCVAG